ncbi:DUF1097 domain-containing protein [Bradyrhizobium sp. 2S1]|uniref:DUF1097 domain-containing protein n=1 Tax=Bradyrhizobium sp. 2S1 TaxID=1404429 RepID=UPI001409FF3B|nr:DUF1097 domain-containing protein [Bradyrhizobium sp. 2S1]MCK7667772.1 DUF1097 domain-containing protein [Bradyrhizobium sp. 2S1]
MTKLPAEVVASLLAVTTIFINMTSFHFPPWAIFITWAGTFAAGGPSIGLLKKFWPTMIIGGIFAYIIVVCFKFSAQHLTGTAQILAECVILFVFNGAMMLLGRIPALSFVPGMFFGFASYFATVFGGFGPVPGDPLAALAAPLLMNLLGPIYAWLTAHFGAHHHHTETADQRLPEVVPSRQA